MRPEKSTQPKKVTMHDMDEDHDHNAMSAEDQAAMAAWIWAQESVELKTIGIDIGSSTSHLLFAKVTLQRQIAGLVRALRRHEPRSRLAFADHADAVPAQRADRRGPSRRFHRSLATAMRACAARIIDTGAVILTGEAIKRTNARAIDEVFAEEAGKFVCATAGHKLECTLAAHGSGAVALSKARDAVVLHVDIGGGTTKLAMIERGQIRSRRRLRGRRPPCRA